MPSHVHLLMTPETGYGVSQLMQSLGRYYVRYINQTYDRTGTLWKGRYKSTQVDSVNYDTLEEVRDSINKAWGLGDGRFKQKIEKKTGR